MPRVKICPTCSSVNPATAIVCGRDGVSLIAIQPLEQQSSPITKGDREVHRICPECNADNSSNSTLCVYCNASLGENKGLQQFRITWPWDMATVHFQKLRIGRQPPAPDFLIKKLSENGYDNISRNHADIFMQDGELIIEDLGSTNGTFVDGERIEKGARRKLGAGAVLRIASNFVCKVTRLEAQH